MTYDEILYSSDGAVGFLTLNNPGKVNALSTKMIGEMSDALRKASGDESIKVVIVRAEGKHFCAGHNLEEMVDKGIKAYKTIFDRCTEMMQLIHDMPQPVIAQVQGIATAAGCQLAAWCDLVVAEEGARFATPGVKIGLFCTTPMVAITRAIGRKAALEMLLTGRYYSAEEAKGLGLINRVVPLADLSAETEALAHDIAGASGFALRVGKQGFYAQVDQADADALHYAKNTIAMNCMAEDAQNGIKAFLKKETPEWKDR